jgi:ferredoxin
MTLPPKTRALRRRAYSGGAEPADDPLRRSLLGVRSAVCAGPEAVNAAEHLICGLDEVTANVEVAEGLALKGRRAASRLEPGDDDPFDAGAIPVHGGRGAMVIHALVGEADGAWIELRASSLQRAVDHCLVAHVLAERFRRPVTCSLDRRYIDALAAVTLPTERQIRDVFRKRSDEVAPPDSGEYEPVDPARAEAVAERLPGEREVLAAAEEAFAQVRDVIGRPLAPFIEHRTEDAQVVIVVAGASRARVAPLIDHWRDAGFSVGLIAVELLQPCPSADILRSVLNAELVVIAHAPRPTVPAWSTKLQLAFAERGTNAPTCVAMTLTADDAKVEPQLRQRIAQAFEGLDDVASAGRIASLPDAGPDDRPTLTIGATAGGPWSKRLLLGFAAYLDGLAPISVQDVRPGVPNAAALIVRPRRMGVPGLPIQMEAPPELDLLILTHPGLLDPAGLGASLREGATMIVVAEPDCQGGPTSTFSEAQRKLIRDKKLRMWWLSAATFDAVDSNRYREDVQAVLHGAALRAMDDVTMPDPLPQSGEEAVKRLADSLTSPESAGGSSRDWLMRGARAVRPCTDDWEPTRTEPTFASPPDKPWIPALPADLDTNRVRQRWATRLTRFHVAGRGAVSSADPLPGVPLRPLALVPLVEEEATFDEFPLLVPDAPAFPPQPMGQAIREAVARAHAKLDTPVLDRRMEKLLLTIEEVLGERRAAQPLGDVFRTAAARLGEALQMSEQTRAEYDFEVSGVTEELASREGRVFGLDDASALDLVVDAIDGGRRAAQTAFRARVRRVLTQLDEIMRLEALTESSRPQADRDGDQPDDPRFGGLAGTFFTPSRVRALAPVRRGSVRLSRARENRIEEARAVLRDYLDTTEELPGFRLVHSGTLPADPHLPHGAVIEAHDSVAAAVGVFDGLAEEIAAVVRALRIGELELDDHYDIDAEQHDEIFANFDRMSLTAEELRAVPAVIAWERAERLCHGRRLARFLEMLHTNRPIHVIIRHAATRLGCESPERIDHDPLRLEQLALANHDAFVAQGTLVRPNALFDALTRMGRAMRPAVTMIAEGVPARGVQTRIEIERDGEHIAGADMQWPWLELSAAHSGRAVNAFISDPDAGPTMADRFSVHGNPQQAARWPSYDVDVTGPDGEPQRLELEVTFAEVAALDPLYRAQLRVIPREAWDDARQLPAAEWVRRVEAAPGAALPAAVPYIYVVDDKRRVARAAITRELMKLVLERSQAWRLLQELGGIDNAFATRAAQAEREAGRERMRAEREAWLHEETERLQQARLAGAVEALENLSAVFLNADATGILPGGADGEVARLLTGAAAPAPVPAVEPPSATVEPGSEPPSETAAESTADASAEPAPEPAPAPASDEPVEPWIDSDDCISCGACLAINPALFVYNDEEHAEIADPTAGTFADLVQAAEECPSRCIHPGTPRPDDATATPDLLDRAAEFTD